MTSSNRNTDHQATAQCADLTLPLNPQADDPAISLLAVLGRVRAGESAGWAGVELGSDGLTVRLHVHGSACHDAHYTLKALAELLRAAEQAT